MPFERQPAPGDLPLDLQLDLLVDDELPEDLRRGLLRSLDDAPNHWRNVAVRFLERQVEKKSARQLIGHGSIIPTLLEEQPPVVFRFPGLNWLTPRRMGAIAAMLVVAAGSALVTGILLRQNPVVTDVPNMARTDQHDFAIRSVKAQIPARAAGLNQPLNVDVPLVDYQNNQQSPSMLSMPAKGPGRQSILIVQDAKGNPVAIPVASTAVKVY